jgi:Cu/Ag efflux protein CusF
MSAIGEVRSTLRRRSLIALVVLTVIVSPVFAADPALADGEVRKVDKDAGKITLKHGEIKQLDMPPMTMVFRVSDPAMLDQVKSGDKVRFMAEKVGGQYTILRMERAE